MRREAVLFLLAALAGAVPLAACVLTRTEPAPPVSRINEAVYRYRGADLEMIVVTRPAELAVDRERWLVVYVGVSGTRRIVTRLHREGLTLELPSRHTLPLASQSEVARSFGEIESFLRRAAIASPPLQYYAGDRRLCAVPFFAEPGRGTVAGTLFVNDRQYCVGSLYFYLDEPVRSGDYVLKVVTRNETGSIPFRLRPAPLAGR